jgi:hypothetical protein
MKIAPDKAMYCKVDETLFGEITHVNIETCTEEITHVNIETFIRMHIAALLIRARNWRQIDGQVLHFL